MKRCNVSHETYMKHMFHALCNKRCYAELLIPDGFEDYAGNEFGLLRLELGIDRY